MNISTIIYLFIYLLFCIKSSRQTRDLIKQAYMGQTK